MCGRGVCVGGAVYYRVCVFITAVPNTKLCAWGEEDSGGHVLFWSVYFAVTLASTGAEMSSDSFTSTNTHRAKKSKFFFKVKNLCFLDKGG